MNRRSFFGVLGALAAALVPMKFLPRSRKRILNCADGELIRVNNPFYGIRHGGTFVIGGDHQLWYMSGDLDKLGGLAPHTKTNLIDRMFAEQCGKQSG